MATRVREPDVVVYVAGQPIRALEMHCRTARNEVGYATVTFPLPLDSAVDHSAVLEIHGVYGDSSAVIHQGSILGPREQGITIRGKQAVVRSDDWWWLMAVPYTEDRAWAGPVSVKTIIRGMFEDREFGQPGKPQFVVHEFKDADDATIMLGGNDDVDGGQVIVKAGTSPFQWIRRVCDLFGYAMSNRYGVPRVTRMYGLPNEDPASSFVEGNEGFEYRGTTDVHQIVTWWDINGAKGTAADGSSFAYRSFPASIPSNPYVPLPTPRIVTDNLLVSDELCDTVRAIKEVEYSDLRRVVRWQSDAQPRRRPGNVVTVTSPSAGLSVATDLWLFSVDHDWDANGGFTSTFEGSFGAGEELPAGSDVCIDVSLGAGPYHVGNETFANYEVPAPEGVSKNFDFTPSVDMTGLSVECDAHSVNEYLLRGQTGTPSSWRLEQPVATEIAEAPLPAMHENIGVAPVWAETSVALSGTLDGGVGARLVLVCGGPTSPPGSVDDFEVRDVFLRHCAEGSPVLPDDPVAPTIPPPVPPPFGGACTYEPSDGTSNYVALAGPWIWPAGKPYALLTGTATGLTGHTQFGGSDPVLTPAQRCWVSTHGGARPLIVPGTQTVADPERTGTELVGSGAFEVWMALSAPSGPVVDQVITGAVEFRTSVSNESGVGEPAFSVSGLCVQFTESGESP